ncbi:MAG: contractile injection system tape measure protein [Novosphingobium sp.]
MLRRHFAEGISRFTGHTPSDLAAGVRGALSRLVPEDREAAREFLADGFREQGLEAGLEMPEHERARIERYLRTGEPYDAAFALPVMASGDRAWLAATVRRLARAVPGQTGRLIDRVFGGLLPQELVECLVPGAGARAARWLEAAGGGTDVQWRTIVSALLEGKEPPFVALSGSTGRRADRLVLLSHWLDHGGSVWWSPESETRDALLGDLTSLTSTETVYLFGGDDVERNFARLFRALDALRPNLRRPLLERLQSLDALPPDTRIASLRGPVSRQRLQVFARAAAVRLGGRRRESGEGAATAAAAVEPSPAGSRVSGPLQAGADDAQLYAWLDGAPVSPVAAAALIRRFAALADKGDSGLSRYLARQGRHAGARRRWASLLPPEALSLLMCVLVPGSAQLWTDAVRFFSAAIRQRNSSGAGGNDAARVWSELLELIEPGRTFPPARGLALLAERLSRNDAAGSLHLREEALKLAEAGGHAAVATALRRTIPRTGQAAPGTVPADATARAKKTEMSEDMPPETDDAVFIDNAGLVLLAPYLPVLFERLGLLAETDKGPRILGAEAMSRGVHLLQYMADGRCDQPEPKLVLNKVLCGLATAQPVAPSIIPSDADREICDSLIAAVIANWPIIANSSPAALRETFLGREGRLTHGSDRWDLQVQRKTLDVLVDQVPWSFGVIFHRWMPVPVHVEW